MNKTIFTDRLKLTLIETAELGSKELEWLHEIKSNEKAQWWRLEGTLKTIQDTQRVMKDYLPLAPASDSDGAEKTYRVVYAVHELLLPPTPSTSQDEAPTRFIGLIALRSTDSKSFITTGSFFPLPSPPYLILELSYQFLPSSWSRGFATESLNAVFDACRAAKEFWNPWDRVFVRAIVVAENAASLRVVEKVGLRELTVYVWEGEPAFLAGRWSGREELRIWGGWVVGGET